MFKFLMKIKIGFPNKEHKQSNSVRESLYVYFSRLAAYDIELTKKKLTKSQQAH